MNNIHPKNIANFLFLNVIYFARQLNVYKIFVVESQFVNTKP